MSRRMPIALGWMLALPVIAAFCALGFWQLQRGQHKQDMLAEVERAVARREAQPLSVAADGQRSARHEWVAGEGHFPALPAVLLDNQIRDSRPGLRLYRVFVPASADAQPLLVDMGWLPMPGDRQLPAIEPAPAFTRVEGLLAPPPSAGIAAPGVTATAAGDLLAIGLDEDVLSGALQLPALAPRVLKLDPALGGNYVRDLDILPNTLAPERHLGYAVQWFGLALALLVTVLVLTVRGRRR